MSVKKLVRKSPCFCVNLRKAASVATEHYNSCLAPCAITVSQYSLLRNLQFMGPSTITELADQVELERSTLARTLKPLFESGYIEDLSEPGSRNKKLQVTASGEELLRRATPLWKKAQANMEQALGDKNLQAFMKKLQNLGSL